MSFSPNFRGTTAKGSSRQLTTNYFNDLVSTITKSTPVSTDPTGNLELVDVTSENSVKRIVGLAYADIASSSNGPVIDSGRLENVTTSFAIGDALYVDTAGNLTNIKPNIGSNSFVSGDWVVFVGVVVINEYNSLNKDIKLMLSVVGQL